MNQTTKQLTNKQAELQSNLSTYQTDHQKNRNQLTHSSRASKPRTKPRSKKELINGLQNVTFRNEDHSLMSISSANREHNGKYECLTSNTIGTTHSESVTLDIKCKY